MSADGDAGAPDRVGEVTDAGVSEWLSLEPGEEVEWVGEPTKLRMVGTVATGVVLIPLLVGIVILLFSPLSYLSIKRTDYVVTTRSLYVKRGVLSTNIESVDLDRIQNTEFTQSFWGTQLGYGTIEISTAGSSGADLSFSDVEDAREVRERISRVQREFGGDRSGDGTGGDRPGRPAGADQLDELVAELRATREALERVERRMREGSSDASAAGAGPREDDGDESGDDSDGRDTADESGGSGWGSVEEDDR